METNKDLTLQDIYTLLNKLTSYVHKLNIEPKERMESELTNELDAALAKAQGDFEVAGLNKSNPYFKSKYADLMSVVMASRGALSKNGLSVKFKEMFIDGDLFLYTTLAHNSGQFTKSKVKITPPKNDIQSISSTISYWKRICYSSITGVVTGDEDDDGEMAMVESRANSATGVALNRKYDPRNESSTTISKEQLEELEYELQEYPDIAKLILDGLAISGLSDLPKSKYLAAIQRVREIKRLRNEGK
jgi:hypothetical protein